MSKPVAYLEGKYVPLEDAKISIMTHAFLYGTACFEGIRAYWNEDDKQLYVFRLLEHFKRMKNSTKITRIFLEQSAEELSEITLELLRKSDFRGNDVYIRPVAYKSGLGIGVKLTGIENNFCCFATEYGKYIDTSKGLKVAVSSWAHVEDNCIPMRAKVNGAYINAAYAKSEALDNGYDEAIFMNRDGHVSEGSAENFFMVREGKLVTPSVSSHILEGITRDTLMKLAAEEMGVTCVERVVDRSELYICEEAFICGTGAELAPIVSVDRVPVGDGKVGPIAKELQSLYYDVVRGKNKKYMKWCTPVF
ncbi:MAG TPA: branched-chain amino acid transaminase [Bacillota bacterium]|nr:branched-chain amino acid transaminase [Bacillota bacterium]HOH10855.1 branched-chain amino acid transaminase [Bacillota bacterium]HOS50847.1 branched-chain amino acid transaminase [Bacillota bacterium]HPI00800.1 branched-chain amino acid transaminase [Bacillota bacterium]HPM63983.1 branched-chain amino acid transaminase [Bacillota bacterium]